MINGKNNSRPVARRCCLLYDKEEDEATRNEERGKGGGAGRETDAVKRTRLQCSLFAVDRKWFSKCKI